MAGYARPSGALAQDPAGDPQARFGIYPAKQYRGGENDGQQHTGRGGRTHKQTGRTDVSQHADHVPEHAKPGHRTTVPVIRKRWNCNLKTRRTRNA
jgi:hypothetical protein